MNETEGVSIKLVHYLIEEFAMVDALYAAAREALPVTANSAVYDAITNSVCDDSLYNVIERLPPSLSLLVSDLKDAKAFELAVFTRELYDTWLQEGRPSYGDLR